MVIRKETASIGDGVAGGNANLESRSKNIIRPGDYVDQSAPRQKYKLEFGKSPKPCFICAL